MARDGKGGYAAPKTEKGTTPNIKPTRYAGQPQAGGMTEKVQPTHETRRGELNTNSNIGCGYGSVMGKGKRY